MASTRETAPTRDAPLPDEAASSRGRSAWPATEVGRSSSATSMAISPKRGMRDRSLWALDGRREVWHQFLVRRRDPSESERGDLGRRRSNEETTRGPPRWAHGWREGLLQAILWTCACVLGSLRGPTRSDVQATIKVGLIEQGSRVTAGRLRRRSPLSTTTKTARPQQQHNGHSPTPCLRLDPRKHIFSVPRALSDGGDGPPSSERPAKERLSRSQRGR